MNQLYTFKMVMVTSFSYYFFVLNTVYTYDPLDYNRITPTKKRQKFENLVFQMGSRKEQERKKTCFVIRFSVSLSFRSHQKYKILKFLSFIYQ
jgi:hypothetical protein